MANTYFILAATPNSQRTSISNFSHCCFRDVKTISCLISSFFSMHMYSPHIKNRKNFRLNLYPSHVSYLLINCKLPWIAIFTRQFDH
jgi:hypothetical protein